MRICYPDGWRQDAVILALNRGVMRVAFRGCDDAVEFTFINGDWYGEELQPVSFEFPCACEARDTLGSTARLAVGRIRESYGQ